jgi:hypothetical protein
MTGKAPKDDKAREARLAEALRANLKRRKDGTRRRASSEQSDDRMKERESRE